MIAEAGASAREDAPGAGGTDVARRELTVAGEEAILAAEVADLRQAAIGAKARADEVERAELERLAGAIEGCWP